MYYQNFTISHVLITNVKLFWIFRLYLKYTYKNSLGEILFHNVNSNNKSHYYKIMKYLCQPKLKVKRHTFITNCTIVKDEL